MTSYGDPHAGSEYDDGYYPPSAGRAQVPPPPPAPGPYGYPDQQQGYADNGYGYPDQGGYRDYQGHNGYPQQHNGYDPNGYDPNPHAYGGPNGYADNGNGYGDPNGYHQPDPGYYAPAPGRAPVPAASGRASVPMVSGRAAVLTPTAPGPSGRAAVRPVGMEEFEAEPKPKRKSSKRKFGKWQKWVVAGVALMILLAGGGLIAGTYFYDTVKRPEELTLDLSTSVWTGDGKQIAKMGKKNRIPVVVDKADGDGKISKTTQYALIAGEDKSFFEHDGIDLWGIGRAAWNNLTGGTTQGASTITQQYARHAAQDMDVTYARKLREAVMARKLEDDYEKHEILGFYLNTVYFGRGADGVGAAAKAYFGDKVSAETMTVEQAALLGAVLRQPEPDGSEKGYDPHYAPEAAKDRWNYVLNNMVEKGWLDKGKRDQMKFPEVAPYDPGKNTGEWGYTDSGSGHVINYVRAELEQQGYLKKLNAEGIKSWRDSGIKVTVTLDSRVQDSLQKYIQRGIEGSLVTPMPESVMAAAVAIDPKTGRVMGYFGGTNGTGPDFAGTYNEGGVIKGGHRPASSFKIYTLAAALEAGYSIKSMVDPTPLKSKKDGGTDEITLGNAGRDPGELPCATYCQLEEMTIKSYNVPFYKIARELGAPKVIETAMRAGVTRMWEVDTDKSYDLIGDPNGKNKFDAYVGFGKYPITVLDHASGAATLANHGTYFKPHFVMKVEKKNPNNGKFEIVPGVGETLKGEQRIKPVIADEVTSVLKQISKGHALDGGARETAGKTGTWEANPDQFPGENAHAWFVGYTDQLAAAVWVGNKDVELPLRTKPPVNDKNGKPNYKQGEKIGGSGLPGEIFEQFMNAAHKALNLKRVTLSNSTGIGNPQRGDGKSPTPGPPECVFPMMCPTTPPGNGGGGGGGGGGNGGGGGGGFPWPRPTATRTPG